MTSTPAGPDGDDSSVDVEAAWADIIARWDEEQPPVGRWPASEDTDDDTDGLDDAATQVDEALEGWDDVPSHVGGEPAREAADEPEPDDEEEGYVPPEPPPLPRGDLFTTLAWAGVLGTPLFFVFTAMFWRTVPQLLIVAAIAAFVGGFLTLVLRMPDHRDDDPDDGAVV
jgi:hypothetical protein